MGASYTKISNNRSNLLQVLAFQSFYMSVFQIKAFGECAVFFEGSSEDGDLDGCGGGRDLVDMHRLPGHCPCELLWQRTGT